MENVARVVLALEAHDVVEEVMHFLDRSGRARVVATASDDRQLAEAVRQLELDAGESPVIGESNMFVGCTVQVNNVVEMNGSQLGNSTLGRSVTKIFNREFMPKFPGDIFRPRTKE